jgi:hypothetical protein
MKNYLETIFYIIKCKKLIKDFFEQNHFYFKNFN